MNSIVWHHVALFLGIYDSRWSMFCEMNLFIVVYNFIGLLFRIFILNKKIIRVFSNDKLRQGNMTVNIINFFNVNLEKIVPRSPFSLDLDLV